MQKPIPKFRQSSFISKKAGYFPEKLKILTSSNYHKVHLFIFYFLLKFCTYVSVLPMSTKGSLGFFLFCLDLKLVINLCCFCDCVETRSFLILANNSSSKQNKKNPEFAFVDVGK